MAEINSTVFSFAVLGGLLPIFFWLWFWLKQDIHPEPKKILIFTFFAGMAVIIPVLAAEYLVSIFFKGAFMLLIWAFIEEFAKYFIAWKVALKKPFFDEPIDALVYLITAALGFSALENILFILKSFSSEGLLSSFITGNLRFIGATLLHTATAAIIGASIAFSFFHKEKRKYNIFGGILLAGFLHFTFNYFIIKSTGRDILKVLIPLWLGIIIIIFICEKVKRIKT